MSQELIELTGRREIESHGEGRITFSSSPLMVTSFTGPNGPMLQFTAGEYVPQGGYTQLTKQQVIELVHVLINWL